MVQKKSMKHDTKGSLERDTSEWLPVRSYSVQRDGDSRAWFRAFVNVIQK